MVSWHCSSISKVNRKVLHTLWGIKPGSFVWEEKSFTYGTPVPNSMVGDRYIKSTVQIYLNATISSSIKLYKQNSHFTDFLHFAYLQPSAMKTVYEHCSWNLLKLRMFLSTVNWSISCWYHLIRNNQPGSVCAGIIMFTFYL